MCNIELKFFIFVSSFSLFVAWDFVFALEGANVCKVVFAFLFVVLSAFFNKEVFFKRTIFNYQIYIHDI